MPRTSHLFVALLVACLALCAQARQHEGTSAHLLVLKSVGNEYAVVSQNLTISINIFNVGQSPAFEIDVNDGQEGAEVLGLNLVDGSHTIRIDRINPGENRTHTYVVNPILAGTTSSGPAKVTYKFEPNGEETREVQSNSLHSIPVLTAEEYGRQTATHILEYIVFGVVSTLLVAVPHHTYKTALKNLQA